MNNTIRKYNSFEDFVRDFIFVVMSDGYASIICHWQDTQGILSSLFERTINGESFALDIESGYSFDEEINTARMNDDNMMITVFDTGAIICTAPIFMKKPMYNYGGAFYIEYDAITAMDYDISGNKIPFRIECK